MVKGITHGDIIIGNGNTGRGGRGGVNNINTDEIGRDVIALARAYGKSDALADLENYNALDQFVTVEQQMDRVKAYIDDKINDRVLPLIHFPLSSYDLRSMGMQDWSRLMITTYEVSYACTWLSEENGALVRNLWDEGIYNGVPRITRDFIPFPVKTTTTLPPPHTY
jgi:hypothetical protein